MADPQNPATPDSEQRTTPLPMDHHCPWREECERLRARIAVLETELAQLKRHVYGQRSEKMPPVADELRRTGAVVKDPEEALRRRRQNALLKEALLTEDVEHRVAPEKKKCVHCGATDLKPLGKGKTTYVFEYVPGHLVRRRHHQQVLVCPCGKTIVTAEGPKRVGEQGAYGPGFIAHLVTAKCADAIALNRTATQFRRQGVPLARSTVVDLFQLAGRLLSPLADRVLELIAQADLVQADETPMRVQAKGKTRRAYVWTFVASKLVGYKFSPSRSGETPSKVLGASQGTLVVDAYTGYNEVTAPDKRLRAGCIAHARRKFFDAKPTAPEAQEALDAILDLYRVEHEAKAAGILGTPEHLKLRAEKSRPVMERFHAWLEAEQPKHLPKGPMANAIGYALNQWEALTRFLDDPQIPLDNNVSERALRIAALGRQNFLFVGTDEAGENLATLYTLVKTAEANGIDPEAYLADVLIRIGDAQAKLDDLLPHLWKPAPRPIEGPATQTPSQPPEDPTTTKSANPLSRGEGQTSSPVRCVEPGANAAVVSKSDLSEPVPSTVEGSEPSHLDSAAAKPRELVDSTPDSVKPPPAGPPAVEGLTSCEAAAPHVGSARPPRAPDTS